MTLEKIISKLLYDHDCVIVPGLGGFIANYSPAAIHPVRHTFTPPSRKLAFNAGLKNNDGLLANAIGIELGIPFSSAVELLSSEVAHIHDRLSSGEKLVFSGIGELYHDREQNLQFNPDISANFSADSFGLTSFTSAPIKREALHEKLSRKLLPQQAVRSSRRLPASLKWAAVFLPLISLGLWSAFNPDRVVTFYNNHASFLPGYERSETQPSKTNNQLTKAIKNPVAATAPVTEQPASDSLSVISVKTEPAKPEVYFIIAGAFSVEENAQKLSERLRSEGYDSFIAGQNRRGLYRVTIQGFSERKPALEKLAEFRNGEYPGAWLLLMK